MMRKVTYTVTPLLIIAIIIMGPLTIAFSQNCHVLHMTTSEISTHELSVSTIEECAGHADVSLSQSTSEKTDNATKSCAVQCAVVSAITLPLAFLHTPHFNRHGDDLPRFNIPNSVSFTPQSPPPRT
ncbi:MAG: hypothetical protein CMF31_09555 [Kordiimonas sp.]|nr:hypothetical protein [Kordiimonas sp.]